MLFITSCSISATSTCVNASANTFPDPQVARAGIGQIFVAVAVDGLSDHSVAAIGASRHTGQQIGTVEGATNR